MRKRWVEEGVDDRARVGNRSDEGGGAVRLGRADSGSTKFD